MPRDLRSYLFDIAEACSLVEEFVRDTGVADYADDALLRSAVERQLEIVGEALGQALRIYPAILSDEFPEAPRIVAFRNRLAHAYATIVDDIVWAITQSEVPALHRRVDDLLSRMGDGKPGSVDA